MMATTEKQNDKVKQNRQTFRFSLHNEEHKDVIRMLLTCPKTKHYQLIVDAMRYFNDNYLNDLKGQGPPGPTLPVFNKTEGNAMGELNISDMFT